MRVTRLKLANVRAITEAEFHFQPGFNLIVGVNGVGKTSVLQAISRGMANAIQAAQSMRTEPPAFTAEDVRHGSASASIGVKVQIGSKELEVTEDFGSVMPRLARPGTLVSKLDVHAKDVRRRGRLQQAQRESIETAEVREGPRFLPKRADFKAAAQGEAGHLMCVYFGTARATAPGRRVKKKRAVPPTKAAYSEAFVGRDLGLAMFADWIAVLETTAAERDDAGPILEALNSAVQTFLPGYAGISVVRDPDDGPPELHIERSDAETVPIGRLGLADRQRVVEVLRMMQTHMDLNWQAPKKGKSRAPEIAETAAKERERIVVRELERIMPGYASLRGPFDKVPADIAKAAWFNQFFEDFGDQFKIDRLPHLLHADQLSDGERSSLAFVLDLTRRLAQANPKMLDPAKNAEAVVLIDELELHLHPKWQRRIVDNLTTAFPKCQFIATTHSPQVIGEVRHEQIQIMADGEVYSPSHSFGVDSSRVLEEIMDSSPRAEAVDELLGKLSRTMSDQKYTKAKKQIAELVAHLGEDDPEVTRARTLLEFMEGDQ